MVTIDCTLALGPHTPRFPGDRGVSMRRLQSIGEPSASQYNLSWLQLGTHSGTHLDAPLHVFEQGSSVDQAPLELLWGPARVLDVRGRGPEISERALAAADLRGVRRLLLRTCEPSDIEHDAAHLSLHAARWLRRFTQVRLIGIDTLSIEAWDSPQLAVHRELLAEPDPVWVIEGLQLASVEPGDWELACLPCKVLGGDGAPARVLLRSTGASSTSAGA